MMFLRLEKRLRKKKTPTILGDPRILADCQSNVKFSGGDDRICTGVKGFADLCLTTRPRRQV